MKILVTGGAGFIGSALIRHIIGHTENSVINIDKLTYAANLQSLEDISGSERYAFEKIDVCDQKKLAACFSKYQPDAIIHLAAESHVDRSIKKPADFIQTNLLGTYALLNVAHNYWANLSESKKLKFRFHHVSTDEVYGDLGDAPDRFTESTAYQPNSPYSASKAGSDHLVRAWFSTYGFPVLITNCSNNYGPYQFPEKLIPLMILNALQGKPLPVYGDGEHVRDWLYVDDHVRALYAVLNNGTTGETYNIGGNNEKKNIDVVHLLCSILEELVPGKPGGIAHYRDLITFVKDRPGHDRRYAIDSGKISAELDWAPWETFESGLRKTVEWYLSNSEWVENVTSGAYQEWIKTHYK